MKKLLLSVIGAFCFTNTAHAAPILLSAGSTYTQNFDTLASTGTSSSLPLGVLFSESGTNANAIYTAGTGSIATGDTYSFGVAGSTDRAFGTLLSGSLNSTIGFNFQNTTGGTINSLTVGYTGEQYRLGDTGRGADRLDFAYSLNATDLLTGTYTDVNELDFSSPVTTGTVGTVFGTTARSFTIANLNIANNAQFFFRFSDFNVTGSDDGLAIDDFFLSTAGVAAVPEPSTMALLSAGLASLGLARRRKKAAGSAFGEETANGALAI